MGDLSTAENFISRILFSHCSSDSLIVIAEECKLWVPCRPWSRGMAHGEYVDRVDNDCLKRAAAKLLFHCINLSACTGTNSGGTRSTAFQSVPPIPFVNCNTVTVLHLDAPGRN